MRVTADGIRLGCVKYLNARPLIHGWKGEVEFDTPSALCRRLAAAELDVALVSSSEFLSHPIYTIVDDVAIGADGPVSSVFLAHAGPLEAVQEVVLDPASRASVHLLRCLLAENGLNPRLVSPHESLPITHERAQLFIGDQAILFQAQHGAAYRYRDLAGWWKEMTGLPFVFALWLIRPEVQRPDAIAASLRARRDANLAALDPVIAAQNGFAPDFCERYFRENLRFAFGAREKAGLLHFRTLCERHGLLAAGSAELRLA